MRWRQSSTPPRLHASSGLDRSTFDRAIRPQDDLFQFVNGAWVQRADIPADRVSITAFTELADEAERDIHAIIEGLGAARRRAGSAEQQIADLYASMMNEDRIEALGDAPLRGELRKIEQIRSAKDFAAEAGYLSAITAGGPFFGNVAVDARDPGVPIVHISQGGLLLPDRDHYLSQDEKYRSIRERYEHYLATIFQLTNRVNPAADARAVLAVEISLAQAQWSPADSRNPALTRNRFTLAELASTMPGFDWGAWAKPQGIDRTPAVIIAQPSFFKTFAAMVPLTPLSTWQAWLAARYITASAPYVSHEFSEARFEMFGRVLTGQEAPRARWKRGVGIVNTLLGQAAGRLYVQKFFSADARSRVQKIVANLLEAYRRAIRQADWMSGSTRGEALRKLTMMTAKIGYPDTWRDYGGLVIRPDDLIGNLQRGQKSDNEYRMARLGFLANRGEWPIAPQMINAAYSPAQNEILFPAAVLQPPLFNADAEDAVNYGAIGAVIGHEIGHAFDEQGRQFDAGGATRNWWSNADELAYRNKVRQVIDQLNALRPGNGARLNGELVAGESVGDLAGLSIAYRAYQLSLGGKSSPVIDGFTGAQRLFLSWAQVWRSKVRPEYSRQQLTTSPYPPAEVRANWTVANLSEFYEAFGVKPGDRLFRTMEQRVAIW